MTALSLFADCPRKYYLSRYLGFDGRTRKDAEHALAPGEPAGLSAAELGSQVHALLAGSPCREIALPKRGGWLTSSCKARSAAAPRVPPVSPASSIL